jgi:CubicO group peptidase (beta-lactamase class C family)
MIGLAAALRPPLEQSVAEGGRPVAVGTARERFVAGLRWASVPGASVTQLSGGKVRVWEAGRTSALWGGPVGATTQFEAASLSKPLTAYAILRLVTLGKLDLDASITRLGHTFTLRQVLSHTAGFSNELSGTDPKTGSGQFIYAGDGYLFLGEVIEQATGQSFADHMNTVVLPELGMDHSRFGRGEEQSGSLAKPSIDLGLPFAVAGIATFLAALVAHLALTVAGRIFGGPGRTVSDGVRVGATAMAILCGIAAVWKLFGAANFAVLAGACGSVFLGFATAAALVSRRENPARLIALVIAGLLVGVLALRPALPLVERRPMHLPAAGLRTTSTDYARFLSAALSRSKSDPVFAQMFKPQTRVSDDIAWGLGFGLQSAPTPAAWHWGVNFPGYQALALIDLETGDTTVVLMNGGAMTPTLEGMRYAGLEQAQGLIAETHGRSSRPPWQGVQ